MGYLIWYDLIAILFHVKILWDILSLKGIKVKNCLQLTSISFFSTLIYFLISFISILFNLIIKCNEIIAFSFAMSSFVFESFWLLYAVFPKALNSQELKLSIWLSFSLHGGNFVFLLIKIFFIMSTLTPVDFNILSIVVISTLYAFFGKVIYSLYEIAIYPIFKKGVILMIVLTLFSIVLVKINNLGYCFLIKLANT